VKYGIPRKKSSIMVKKTIVGILQSLKAAMTIDTALNSQKIECLKLNFDVLESAPKNIVVKCTFPPLLER
jgi:hypothetical protein